MSPTAPTPHLLKRGVAGDRVTIGATTGAGYDLAAQSPELVAAQFEKYFDGVNRNRSGWFRI